MFSRKSIAFSKQFGEIVRRHDNDLHKIIVVELKLKTVIRHNTPLRVNYSSEQFLIPEIRL